MFLTNLAIKSNISATSAYISPILFFYISVYWKSQEVAVLFHFGICGLSGISYFNPMFLKEMHNDVTNPLRAIVFYVHVRDVRTQPSWLVGQDSHTTPPIPESPKRVRKMWIWEIDALSIGKRCGQWITHFSIGLDGTNTPMPTQAVCVCAMLLRCIGSQQRGFFNLAVYFLVI